MSKQHQLKQACQYIMNAIIQNASLEQRDMIRQDQQFSIIQGQYIMINLDKQSENFGLFAPGTQNQSHWIGRMLDHFEKAYQSFPIQIRQSTISQQLISYLIAQELQPIEQNQLFQAVMTIDNIKLRQILLYQKSPKFSLLLITFQPINTHFYINIIRNFHGQIIELSVHSSNSSKYQTLLNSVLFFHSPFIIIFDMIDMDSFYNYYTLRQQIFKLSQRIPLAYFVIKSEIRSTTLFPTKSYCYYLQCNTFFSHQNYNHRQNTLRLSQIETNRIKQSFIDYHKSLFQQQTKKISLLNLEHPKLIKGILKINYQRKIQIFNHLRDQIKFKDFINSEFQIFIRSRSEMWPNQPSKKIHQKHQLKTPGNCLACQKSQNKYTLTSSTCIGCPKNNKHDFYFCDKCFEAYHQSKHLLLNNTDKKVPLSDQGNSQGAIWHGLDVYSKDKKDVSENQQQINNENIIKMRRAQLKKQKQVKLTENQMKDIANFQSIASNIVKLIGHLKNPDLLYKSKSPEITSEQQYQAQLKNQAQFQKLTDKNLMKQLEIFQESVFVQISYIKEKPKIELQYKQQPELIDFDLEACEENLSQEQMDLEEPYIIDQGKLGY